MALTMVDIDKIMCYQEKVNMFSVIPSQSERIELATAINLRLSIGHIGRLILGDDIFPRFMELIGYNSRLYHFVKRYFAAEKLSNSRYDLIVKTLIKSYNWDTLTLDDIRKIFYYGYLTEKDGFLLSFGIIKTKDNFVCSTISNADKILIVSVNIKEVDFDSKFKGALKFSNKNNEYIANKVSYVIYLPKIYIRNHNIELLLTTEFYGNKLDKTINCAEEKNINEKLGDIDKSKFFEDVKETIMSIDESGITENFTIYYSSLERASLASIQIKILFGAFMLPNSIYEMLKSYLLRFTDFINLEFSKLLELFKYAVTCQENGTIILIDKDNKLFHINDTCIKSFSGDEIEVDRSNNSVTFTGEIYKELSRQYYFKT